MGRHSSRAASLVIVAAASLLVAGAALASKKVRIQTGPDAEVTYDGLHRVDRTAVDRVWVKPDIDLTRYTKMIVVGAPMSFREVEEPPTRTSRARASKPAREYPIDPGQRERLQEIFSEEFRKELASVERFEITDEPGPDVMVLVGTVIDVVSSVPPPTTGRTEVYLSKVGEATLVLQIHDSLTNEILLRAADRREAESGRMVHANAASTWSEVRRLAQSWAARLRRRLDDVGSYVAEPDS